MIRRFTFLTTLITGTALIVCGLLTPLHAEEEEPLVITGKLSAYAKSSIVVDGEPIDLCEEAQVLDPKGMQIRIDGLVATETVSVIIRDGCAIEVRALEMRK